MCGGDQPANGHRPARLLAACGASRARIPFDCCGRIRRRGHSLVSLPGAPIPPGNRLTLATRKIGGECSSKKSDRSSNYRP
jgi:hypothetical protein